MLIAFSSDKCHVLLQTADDGSSRSLIDDGEDEKMKAIEEGHLAFMSLLSNRLRCLQSFTINFSINNIKVLYCLSVFRFQETLKINVKAKK